MNCALALALLLDVSGSVGAADYELQRDATSGAMTSQAVIHAARDGLHATAIMWGSGQHVVAYGMLRTAGHAAAFAATLSNADRPEAGMTDVAGAIRAGARAVLAQDCERRVLDISGDGSHSGDPDDVADAVREAVEAGVEINVLPIITEHEPKIAEWYRENVAEPAGGFVMPATWEGFARAIRAKLAMEIAAR